MAIPEHVKKQALDAVANKETTAQIRQYQKDYQPPATSSQPLKTSTPAAPGTIPDHVKKLALEAVANKETTAQIRQYHGDYKPASSQPPKTSTPSTPSSPGSIPKDVLKQAQAAVASKETTAQIKLVTDKGRVAPGNTPATGKAVRHGEKVAELIKSGHSADELQEKITKDSFDRS